MYYFISLCTKYYHAVNVCLKFGKVLKIRRWQSEAVHSIQLVKEKKDKSTNNDVQNIKHKTIHMQR